METSNTVEVKKVREDSVDSTPLIVANSKKEIDVPQPTEEKASITIVIGRKPNTNSELLKPEDMQIKIPNTGRKMSRRSVEMIIMPSRIKIKNIGNNIVRIKGKRLLQRETLSMENNIDAIRNFSIKIGPHVLKTESVKHHNRRDYSLQTLVYEKLEKTS